jgi:hypothetical protein
VPDAPGGDILINNVGGGDPDRFATGGFLDSTDDQWRELHHPQVHPGGQTGHGEVPEGTLLEAAGEHPVIPGGHDALEG